MEPLRAEDPRRVGRYRLVARLGAGGMGRVFLGFTPVVAWKKTLSGPPASFANLTQYYMTPESWYFTSASG